MKLIFGNQDACFTIARLYFMRIRIGLTARGGRGEECNVGTSPRPWGVKALIVVFILVN